MSNPTSTKSEARTIIGAAVVIFLVGIALIAGVVIGVITTIETERPEHFAATLGMTALASLWWIKIIDILTDSK